MTSFLQLTNLLNGSSELLLNPSHIISISRIEGQPFTEIIVDAQNQDPQTNRLGCIVFRVSETPQVIAEMLKEIVL